MGTHPALRGGGAVDDTAYVDPTAFIAGSATVGARTYIGPGAFVNGGVHIGTDCIVCGGVQVLANVPNGTTVPCPPTGVTGITPGTGIAVSGSIPGPLTVSVANGAAGVDRNTFIVGSSVAGQNTAPLWDRYNPWGLQGGYSSASADALSANTIQAIPCWFNKTGTIDKILSQLSTGPGRPADFFFSMYANNGDGQVWPGALLAQMAPININSVGSSVVIQWIAGIPVTAGTLLWLATNVGTNQVNCAGRSAPASNFPCIMGTQSFGIAGASPPSGFDPTPCAAIKSIPSVYTGTAPSTFPTASPTLALGSGTFDPLPIHAFRFVV